MAKENAAERFMRATGRLGQSSVPPAAVPSGTR